MLHSIVVFLLLIAVTYLCLHHQPADQERPGAARAHPHRPPARAPRARAPPARARDQGADARGARPRRLAARPAAPAARAARRPARRRRQEPRQAPLHPLPLRDLRRPHPRRLRLRQHHGTSG